MSFVFAGNSDVDEELIEIRIFLNFVNFQGYESTIEKRKIAHCAKIDEGWRVDR